MEIKEKKRAKLNIVLATDENYVVPTTVVIESALNNNINNVELIYYVICDNLNEWKQSSKYTLEKYNQNANARIILLDSIVRDAWCAKHHILKYKGSYGIYTKFFMTEIVEDKECNVLWLDSDIVVTGSLLELALKKDGIWCCYDMNNSEIWRDMLGLEKDKQSFAGIFSCFLVNPQKWEKINAIEKITSWMNKFCTEKFDKVCDLVCVDQGILSGALEGYLDILPMNYQVIPGQYLLSHHDFSALFGLNESDFYSDIEYHDALKKPIIIHYMHFIVPKPWYHDNLNPCEDIWLEYYSKVINASAVFPLKEYSMKGIDKYKRNLFCLSKKLYILLGKKYIKGIIKASREKIQSYYIV